MFKKTLISILLIIIFGFSIFSLSGCVMEDNILGVKYSFYQVNNSDEINLSEDFKTDLINKSKLLSQEILLSLCSQYGYGLPLNYVMNNYGEYCNNLTATYSGINPFGSSNSIHYEISNTTNHSNSINKSFVSESVYHSWNWQANTISTEQLEYLNAFVNNENISKLQIALLLINAGYDFSSIEKNGYTEYTSALSQDRELYINNLLSSGKIKHMGLSESGKDMLFAFICNEIIGSNIITIDNTLFNDLNSNGNFDSEECIVYTESLQVFLDSSVYQDINLDNHFNYTSVSGNIESRKSYFKNYSNTISNIIENLLKVEDIFPDKTILRYPLIFGLSILDASADAIAPEFNEEDDDIDFFARNMKAQIYQNIVFMQEEDLNLESVELVFESQYDFSLSVYVRIVQNGVLTAEQYISTVDIRSGKYADVSETNNIYVDFENISNFDSDYIFEQYNDSFSAHTIKHLSLSNYNLNYSQTSIDGLRKVISYKDTTNSYAELCFSADRLVPFKIGYQILSYSSIEN